MSIKTGLWIDHRRALIVTTFDGGETQLEIQSHVESQPGREEGIRSTAPFEAQLVEADDRRERAYQGHLNPYYTEVIQAIRDADAIFILGPGEAKEELRKHLERARLGDKVVDVEPAGTLTDPQIAAKVRGYFHPVAAS